MDAAAAIAAPAQILEEESALGERRRLVRSALAGLGPGQREAIELPITTASVTSRSPSGWAFRSAQSRRASASAWASSASASPSSTETGGRS